MTQKQKTVYVKPSVKPDNFTQLLDAAEMLLTAISNTGEYRMMIKNGIHGSNDLTLGDAVTAVIECRDEYYSIITDQAMQSGGL